MYLYRNALHCLTGVRIHGVEMYLVQCRLIKIKMGTICFGNEIEMGLVPTSARRHMSFPSSDETPTWGPIAGASSDPNPNGLVLQHGETDSHIPPSIPSSPLPPPPTSPHFRALCVVQSKI